MNNANKIMNEYIGNIVGGLLQELAAAKAYAMGLEAELNALRAALQEKTGAMTKPSGKVG